MTHLSVVSLLFMRLEVSFLQFIKENSNNILDKLNQLTIEKMYWLLGVDMDLFKAFNSVCHRKILP